MPRAALTVLFVTLVGPCASAQRIEMVDIANLPRFDVASVKRGDPNVPGKLDVSPGRLLVQNQPVWNAITIAFDVPRPQLVNPPPDLMRDPFTIEGRLPVTAALPELKLMLRALLIERFKLRVHVDVREQDAYALTLARRDGRFGPQLRSTRVDCRSRAEAERRNEPVAPIPEGSKPCTFKVGAGTLDVGGVPLSTLMAAFSSQVGRPILDKTGLAGAFDAEMQWAPEGSDGPAFVTALQEQLGLRLEPAKTTLDYLVIDHIERPEPD
jgi:uncharacterized protein (TIGR03435 family)